MITKNIFLAVTLCSLTCSASQISKKEKYDLSYLDSLRATVVDNFGKLQTTLKWTNGGEVLSAVSGMLSWFNIVREEVECVPRFKNLADASIKEMNEWLAQQTSSSIDAMLKAVDSYEKLPDLILAQNNRWEKDYEDKVISKEEGFKRLVESAHWKKKHS